MRTNLVGGGLIAVGAAVFLSLPPVSQGENKPTPTGEVELMIRDPNGRPAIDVTGPRFRSGSELPRRETPTSEREDRSRRAASILVAYGRHPA